MKLETFKKRFDKADNILKELLDDKMSYIWTQDKNGILCEITLSRINLPIVTEKEYWEDKSGNGKHLYPKNVYSNSDSKIEAFKKRFEFTNDNLKWILDGNTSSMMTSDKDGIICNIKFDEHNLPIVTENVFDSNMIHSNITVKGSIVRHCNDSEKLSNKITNWLKSKFNIKL